MYTRFLQLEEGRKKAERTAQRICTFFAQLAMRYAQLLAFSFAGAREHVCGPAREELERVTF